MMHAGIETRAALRVGAALCAHAHALHRHASHPHRDRDKEPHGPHLFRTNAGTDALAAPGKGGLSPGLVPVPDKEPRAHERETCLVPCLERAARPGVAAAHNEPSAAENGGKPQDGSAEISMDKETCVVGTAISDLLRENGGKYRDSKRERRRGGVMPRRCLTWTFAGTAKCLGLSGGAGMVCVSMRRYPKACSSAICTYAHIYIHAYIQLWDGLCVNAAVPKGLFKRHM